MLSSVNQSLPSAEELPCSDDTPVDNVGRRTSRSEDQNLLPNLLLLLLTHLWSERLDWYFGADMAIYHTTGPSHLVLVVPDGFLSLGVERKKGGKSRRSYVMWEEQDISPMFVLEMVSHQPGDEYTRKLETYSRLGVLYYVIYNPEFWQRDCPTDTFHERHQPFEVYRLVEGTYQLQIGEPYWMPEVGLGIGRYQGQFGGIPQEILTWYDAQGNRHLSAAEQERLRTEQERQRAEQERQRVERLEAYLR
ncbi:MAG: Uma2 family endonuclease [Cyanobacteria bacterium P01_D01_bin.115]